MNRQECKKNITKMVDQIDCKKQNSEKVLKAIYTYVKTLLKLLE